MTGRSSIFILSSGQHMLSLINDILELSKIEAGRMELAPAPFPLPLALESAITLVKERAARHGITLTLEVDPRLGEAGRRRAQDQAGALEPPVQRREVHPGGRPDQPQGPAQGRAVEVSVC